MRSFFETLCAGCLVDVHSARMPILCISDCRSLYDHLHREGVPKTPSDRRLAVDLAALRVSLREEKWGAKLPLAWVPSPLQFSDILTKPQDPRQWWDALKEPILLPASTAREDGTVNDRIPREKVSSVKHSRSTLMSFLMRLLSNSRVAIISRRARCPNPSFAKVYDRRHRARSLENQMLWGQAHWEQAWQPVGWGFFFWLVFVVGDISRGVGFLTGSTYSFSFILNPRPYKPLNPKPEKALDRTPHNAPSLKPINPKP